LIIAANGLSSLQIFKSKFEMSKLTAYVKDSYRELLEKVTWPTWSQLQQSTMIVLVATLIITGIVWVMDLGIASLLELVYSLFK
jgi:preprotein translocase subunit SecE